MRTRFSIGIAAVASVAAAVLVPISAQGEVVAHGAAQTSSHARSVAPASPRLALKAAAAPKPVALRSTYETATRAISRDVGVSTVLPDGHDLWLFGDTGLLKKTGRIWKLTKFIDGSTALLTKYGQGLIPKGGELPSGVPKRFIPVPKNVYLPNGSGKPCTYKTAAFPARWPIGAALMAGNPSQVLVTYSEVCVTHQTTDVTAMKTEGWGYLLYNWKTHHIDRGPIDVLKPKKNGASLSASKIFGSPYFANGKLTLFSSRCASQFVACKSGQVWSVTMPGTVAALNNPASYKLAQLFTDGSAPWQPLSISIGLYPGGWRLVENASISGAYRIFGATAPAGPWHLRQSGTLPGCPSHHGFCFGLEGHPELSTASQVFVSYKNPDTGSLPGGRVVITKLADS